MPPKKMSEPPLTIPEKCLLDCAARIFAAVLYKEANPNMDHDRYEMRMSVEMVRS